MKGESDEPKNEIESAERSNRDGFSSASGDDLPCRELDYPVDGDWMCITHTRPLLECQAIFAAEARGYERCLKEIDEKCPEVAHTIVRPRLNAK